MGKLLYFFASFPAVLLFVISLMMNVHNYEDDRARYLIENARVAAANLDNQFAQILDLTSFCAASASLIDRVDLEEFSGYCAHLASRMNAWIVVVQLGEVHRQILNTRIASHVELPAYPRENERKELIALEVRSRASGSPEVADVFSGIVLNEGIISAGQFLRLADGREAMLYLGTSAASLSEKLSGLATKSGLHFSLTDPSRRVVARSLEPEAAMFAYVPQWFNDVMNRGASGASLGMPGLEEFGGTWDVGYSPLQNAPGWMASAFQPTPNRTIVWTPLSVSTALTLIGFLFSSVLLWGISLRNKSLRREAAAKEAKELATRQNQEKSRLLASLAHDIRSPLINLIGSLELIDETKEDSVNKVELARSSAESLLQLADDILELSFLGSGKMSFHPSPVDLRQLSKSLCIQLQHLADRKGLVVRPELDPDLPPLVKVDRLRLQQVLTNLLTNAIKYTEKGEVILRVCVQDKISHHITLDISVVDTGVGLAPEEIPRVLREFGRLERHVDLKEPGTGLGLAIVQRLLNAMGTELCVESVQNYGSRFHFLLTLPVLPAQAVVSDAQTLADCVILYAEDEPVIRQVTSQRLEEAGAHVVTAADGEDALRLLCDVTPDLLLIDLQMPGLDGVGLIRRLRETSRGVDYPIFVLTSHISGPQAAKARAAGADAVFTKPIQVSALAAAMCARHGNNGKSTPMIGGTLDIAIAPLLDLSVVQDVSALKDPDKATLLIAQFQEAMATDLSAISSAIDKHQVVKISKIAHRAQGLCLVIGAKRLARVLKRIELAAADPVDTAAMAKLASELDEILTATITDLRSLSELTASTE